MDVRRSLHEIDEGYRPSNEEVAAVAGMTIGAVRRALALALPEG